VLETARAVERAAERRASRKPKQLIDADAPSLMTSTDGQGLAGAPPQRGDDAADPRPGTTGYTDEEGELSDEDQAQTSPNAAVHRAACEIAARLAVARRRDREARTRGTGPLRSVRYRGGGDDLDLDRTLEALAERRPLLPEDIIVRERRRRRRAVVLAVDVSGSMRGERLLTAAAAVGALTAELAHDALAVVAFWSDAAMLVRLDEQPTLEQVVDALLAIQPRGLTNVEFPLAVAEEEQRSAAGRERRVILMSDCVHNAGSDPRAVARRLPRLDVLFDTTAECDPVLARDLARAGRGRVLPVRRHQDVAPALSQILDR
jgi:Mg-chelatase subunit ChlD